MLSYLIIICQLLILLNTPKTYNASLHSLHVSVEMADCAVDLCMLLFYIIYCGYWLTFSINVQMISNTFYWKYETTYIYNSSIFLRENIKS